MRNKFFSIRNSLTFLIITGVLVTIVVRDQNQSDYALNGKAFVSDGDSLRIADKRVRLVGIDAPELDQICELNSKAWPCGTHSRDALQSKIGEKSLTCTAKGRDKYNRTLAVCYLGRENLNAWLVREGWALSYDDYAIDEVLARRERRGIWQSDFVSPKLWRDEKAADVGSLWEWFSNFWKN